MTNWARLAKTIMASTESIEVGVAGQGRPLRTHAITGSGALLFSLSEAAPACAHLVTAGTHGPDIQASAADVSAVPHPGRLRGLVRLSGRAETLPRPVDEQLGEHLDVPDGGLVARLVPESVVLDWRVEAPGGRRVLDIDPGDYAAARIDALAGWCDGWLAHLDAAHRDALRSLLARRGPDAGPVRPVHADEDGLVLRELVGSDHRDVRVSFPHTVRCGCEATEALKRLMTVDTSVS